VAIQGLGLLHKRAYLRVTLFSSKFPFNPKGSSVGRGKINRIIFIHWHGNGNGARHSLMSEQSTKWRLLLSRAAKSESISEKIKICGCCFCSAKDNGVSGKLLCRCTISGSSVTFNL
jgi:hypothetical protein